MPRALPTGSALRIQQLVKFPSVPKKVLIPWLLAIL